MLMPTATQIAQSIDHAILLPDLTRYKLLDEVNVAKFLNVYSVCVRPADVQYVSELLQDSQVKVGTVIGFPHGSSTLATKLFETTNAVMNGAQEIDFVLNISDAKNQRYDAIIEEVTAISNIAKELGAEKTKVIFENAYFSIDEIEALAVAMQETTVDFIKTSTGFASSGAVLEEVAVMAKNRGDKEVKASGGVRTLNDYLAFAKLGVTRFGTSNSRGIIEDLESIQRSTNVTPVDASERSDY